METITQKEFNFLRKAVSKINIPSFCNFSREDLLQETALNLLQDSKWLDKTKNYNDKLLYTAIKGRVGRVFEDLLKVYLSRYSIEEAKEEIRLQLKDSNSYINSLLHSLSEAQQKYFRAFYSIDNQKLRAELLEENNLTLKDIHYNAVRITKSARIELLQKESFEAAYLRSYKNEE